MFDPLYIFVNIVFVLMGRMAYWILKYNYIYLYVITKASYEGICVELERKSNTDLVHLLSNCSQVLNLFYDSPVKYYFWQFWYLITRLHDWVQLSLSSTRAFFHKYFVAMKKKWIRTFLLFWAKVHL